MQGSKFTVCLFESNCELPAWLRLAVIFHVGFHILRVEVGALLNSQVLELCHTSSWQTYTTASYFDY